MNEKLISKLNCIPAEFLPLKEFVQRYSHFDFRIDDRETIQLAIEPAKIAIVE